MKKNDIISIIQKKEREAQLNYLKAENTFAKRNFSSGYGYLNFARSDLYLNDIELVLLRNDWRKCVEILLEINIEPAYSELGEEIVNDTWNYLTHAE